MSADPSPVDEAPANGPPVLLRAGVVEVTAATYRWTWDRGTDHFRLADRLDRTVVAGPLQPVIVVEAGGQKLCRTGDIGAVAATGNALTVEYGGPNGAARVTVRLTFWPDRWRFEPVEYTGSAGDDVVSMHMFAEPGTAGRPEPALRLTYLIQPGLSMATGLGSVLATDAGLTLRSWLGRGSLGSVSQVSQQWGLPVHYFAGVTRNSDHNARNSRTQLQSDAFCCGLGALPDADLLLDLEGGAVSPVFLVRSDLWHHRARVDTQALGAPLIFTTGLDYRSAIRAYYAAVGTEPGRPVEVAAATYQRQTLSAAQVNTWGAQCAAGATSGTFDQKALQRIYDGMRTTGMRPGLFVVDDKWEGQYGRLEHDPDRFPQFEEFLANVRADGHRIGLWAAFLRTTDPTAVGLGGEHLMRDVTGAVLVNRTLFAPEPYGLLDPSHPRVQQVLAELIQRFVARYSPDLVKFDFGYELPGLGESRPYDADFAGERLLHKALEVVVGALRAAKPEIAIMYYSLSPLLFPFVDQHSHDDQYLAVDDYDLEGNRRGFFSSLLAERGLSVYPSGGYDWRTMPQIWLDSAVLGPVGSLNAFDGDEHGDGADPVAIALFNGLAALTRPPAPCRIDPLSAPSVGGLRGAGSRSWLRYERGQLVTAAVRREDNGRLPTDCPIRPDGNVVVASLDARSIGSADRIGVVSVGPARVVIQHESARAATALAHCSDGSRRTFTMQASADRVELTLDPIAWSAPGAEADASAAPVFVEWTEISFGRHPGGGPDQ